MRDCLLQSSSQTKSFILVREMAILYALVARGSVVLAEFSVTSITRPRLLVRYWRKFQETMTAMYHTLRIDTSVMSIGLMVSPFSAWPMTLQEIFWIKQEYQQFH